MSATTAVLSTPDPDDNPWPPLEFDADAQPCQQYSAARRLVVSASMSEAALLRKAGDLCELHSTEHYHTADSRGSRPGFPDLVIVGSNGVLWRELKVNGAKLTFEQRRWARALRDAGQDFEVWTGEDYASGRIRWDLAGLSSPANQAPIPRHMQLRLDEAA